MNTDEQTYQHFKRALAIVESSDNPRAWGDDGLACGRWQMHPAFCDTYRPRVVHVRMSWDEYFEGSLRRFFEMRAAVCDTTAVLAQQFHLGVQAVLDGEWDWIYDQKFERAWLETAVEAT